jgi:hypothetical protein
MITTDWKYLYKIGKGGSLQTTNLLYTPIVNCEETIMCMQYDENSPYQKNKRLTKEIVDFFFEREVKFLTKFQGYKWAPKLLDVNLDTRSVFVEFNGTQTINRVLMTEGRDLNAEYPNWKVQIFEFLEDLEKTDCYKMALYPHCFFFNSNGQLKTFDFYSCVDRQDCLIPRSAVENLIGDDSTGRFDSATEGDYINFEIFFKNTVMHHLDNSWLDNPFREFYKKIYD